MTTEDTKPRATRGHKLKFKIGQLVRHQQSAEHVFVVVGDVPTDDDKLVCCVSPYEMKLHKYERKVLEPVVVDEEWRRKDARCRDLPAAPAGWMTAEEVAREMHGL